jgi:AraC family transcriptional regulator
MNENVHERMQRALDQIEASLSEPITLSLIAEASHFSPYHFARLFRAMFDDSVMNYVRKRRLSHAAHLLKEQHCSILDIAMECGFGSNEAFSRAFRKHYSLSPRTYRQNAQRLHLPIQRKVVMSKISSTIKLSPSFKKLEGFLAIGCSGEFLPGATNDIGQLWENFTPRIRDIHGRVGTATYGICSQPEEPPCDPDRFTYIAAIEVDSLDDIPERMTGIELPAREYAIFAYDGGVSPELPRTMQAIFGEWLPSSEFELDGADFEYYDDEFDPQSGTGRFYIYVPIKRKETVC